MGVKSSNFHSRPVRRAWLIPLVMLIGSAVLSAVAAWLDRASQGLLPQWMPGGGNLLFGVVGISAITVAALSFSITLATLTSASKSFGTRPLRNYMHDRGNLVVLGGFLGTFLYCLLSILFTPDTGAFVPRVSSLIALTLALANVGALIYFIQRVATSIQSPAVTASLATELLREIEGLYPQAPAKAGEEAPEPEEPEIISTFAPDGAELRAEGSGYIQSINHARLLALAGEMDCLIRLRRRAGHFVTARDVILSAHARVGNPAVAVERFALVFTISHDRTPEQDVEYCVNQLVEVALRALSSGINDPFTAMNCVDWLGSAAAKLASRATPSQFRYDNKHQLRVITDHSTFAGFIDSAFDQIRQTGWHHVAVSIRILQVMANLVPHLRTTEQKRIIQTHVELVYGQALDSVRTEYDLRDLKSTYARASEALRKSLGWNKPRLA